MATDETNPHQQTTREGCSVQVTTSHVTTQTTSDAVTSQASGGNTSFGGQSNACVQTSGLASRSERNPDREGNCGRPALPSRRLFSGRVSGAACFLRPPNTASATSLLESNCLHSQHAHHHNHLPPYHHHHSHSSHPHHHSSTGRLTSLDHYGADRANAGLSTKPCLPCPGIPIRWFILVIAVIGLMCAIVGTIIGALRTTGREHLTLALLMIGK